MFCKIEGGNNIKQSAHNIVGAFPNLVIDK